MATKQRMLRFTIHVKRHPSLSEESFHDWWTNEHAPLITGWLTRHNVYRYTQYHTPSWLRIEHLEQASTSSTPDPSQPTPSRGILDSDGSAEIVVPNADCLKHLVEDPFYHDVVSKDEKEHLDPDGFVQTVGYEEVWIKEGVAIAA